MKLDRDFTPFAVKLLSEQGERCALAVSRGDLRQSLVFYAADFRSVDRVCKLLLYTVGGDNVTFFGPTDYYDRLVMAYSPRGSRRFDYRFWSQIAQRPLAFQRVLNDEPFFTKDAPVAISYSSKGRRIGLDLGASNLKIAASRDGQPLVIKKHKWTSGEITDKAAFFGAIKREIDAAIKALGGLDAIGASTCGIVTSTGEIPISNLFRRFQNSAGSDLALKRLLSAYHVPFKILNDGDASAVAASFAHPKSCRLGLSLGTSLGGGLIYPDGKLSSFANEFGFVPIDFSPGARVDEWDLDKGCCVQYLSQKGLYYLFDQAGIKREELTSFFQLETPTQALKDIANDLGEYLGCLISELHHLYPIDAVSIMGGISNGLLGPYMAQAAERRLRESYDLPTLKVEAPALGKAGPEQALAAAQIQED